MIGVCLIGFCARFLWINITGDFYDPCASYDIISEYVTHGGCLSKCPLYGRLYIGSGRSLCVGAEIGFPYIRYSHRAAREPRQVRLHRRLGHCSRWPPITQYTVNMDRSDLTNPHTRSYGGHRWAGGHIGYEILSNQWEGLAPCRFSVDDPYGRTE